MRQPAKVERFSDKLSLGTIKLAGFIALVVAVYLLAHWASYTFWLIAH